MKKIQILTTGGTIEKIYNEQTGQLVNHKSSLKERFLGQLRYPYHQLEVTNVMDKDSLDLDDKDRDTIFHAITTQINSDVDAIVVLHGTDTVDQTVGWCYKKLESPKIPVIFTGAMRPLEFEHSDGVQNIIEAIYACNMASPGFYLSFHGVLYKALSFKKNHARKTFESIV